MTTKHRVRARVTSLGLMTAIAVMGCGDPEGAAGGGQAPAQTPEPASAAAALAQPVTQAPPPIPVTAGELEAKIRASSLRAERMEQLSVGEQLDDLTSRLARTTDHDARQVLLSRIARRMKDLAAPEADALKRKLGGTADGLFLFQ